MKILYTIALLAAYTGLYASASWIPHASGGLSRVEGSSGSYAGNSSRIEYKDGYSAGAGIERRSNNSRWSQSYDVDYSHNAIRSINVGGMSKKVGKSDVADSYTGSATLLYHFPKTVGGLKPYVGVGGGVSNSFGNVVPVYQGVAGVSKDLKKGWNASAEVKARRYGDISAQGMHIDSPTQYVVGVNLSRRF